MWASSFRIRAIWIQWSECRASPLLLPWSAKTLITAPYFRHSWRNSRDPSGLKAAQLFLGRSSWLGLKSSAFPVWCFLFKEGVLRVPYSPKRSLLYDLEHDPLHPETPWDTLRHPETPCHPNVSPWLSCYFPVTFTRCIMPSAAPVRHLHGYRWRTLDPPPNSLATGWTCRAKPWNFKVTAKHSEA